MKKMGLLFALCALCQLSCMTVKEYEKVYINDPDMQLGDKPCDRNVVTAHAYREAASGGNGGKTGGGCGCN